MQHIPTDFNKLIQNESDVAFYLANISASDFIQDIKSILTKSEILRKIPKKSVQDRRLDFRDALAQYLPTYGRDMLNDFFKYWTEMNQSGTRMRFEMEKTYELQRRLDRWDKTTTKKSPEQPTISLKETPRR